MGNILSRVSKSAIPMCYAIPMATETLIPDFPCWRVRIVFHGSMIHVVSSTEPVANDDGTVDFTPVPIYGDEIGLIRWPEVNAVSWRYVIPEGYRPPTKRVEFR